MGVGHKAHDSPEESPTKAEKLLHDGRRTGSSDNLRSHGHKLSDPTMRYVQRRNVRNGGTIFLLSFRHRHRRPESSDDEGEGEGGSGRRKYYPSSGGDSPVGDKIISDDEDCMCRLFSLKQQFSFNLCLTAYYFVLTT